ncbi:MAG: hypothetical protein FWE03_06780 [Firmicutes bacterium]|nr:hypothetical protein [Bacillota bacterium]
MKKLKTSIVSILILALLASFAVFPLMACDNSPPPDGGGDTSGPVNNATAQRIENMLEDFLNMLFDQNTLDEINEVLDLIFEDGLVDTFVDLLNTSNFTNAQVNRLLDFIESLENLMDDVDFAYASWIQVMMVMIGETANLNIPNVNIATFYWEFMGLTQYVLERFIDIFDDMIDSNDLADYLMIIEIIDMIKEFGRTDFIALYTLILDISELVSGSALNVIMQIFELGNEFPTRAIFNALVVGVRNDVLALLNLLDNNAIRLIAELMRFQMYFVAAEVDLAADFDPILDAFVNDWRYIRASLTAMANAVNNTLINIIYDIMLAEYNGDLTWEQVDHRMAIVLARVLDAGFRASNGLTNNRILQLLNRYRGIFADIIDDAFDLEDMHDFFDIAEEMVPLLLQDISFVANAAINADLNSAAFEDNLFLMFLFMLGEIGIGGGDPGWDWDAEYIPVGAIYIASHYIFDVICLSTGAHLYGSDWINVVYNGDFGFYGKIAEVLEFTLNDWSLDQEVRFSWDGETFYELAQVDSNWIRRMFTVYDVEEDVKIIIQLDFRPLGFLRR